MESSFQRLGRGRRFRNKTADASSSTPASSATPVGSERSPASASSGASAPAASPASRPPAAPSAPGEDGYAHAPRAPAPGSTRPGLYGQTLVSTGLSDVDNLLGGGLPLGSVMLVGHDGDGARNAGDATTLLRYFVAEGLASGHTALWMPPRAGARSPARTLPRLVSPDERRAADRDDDDDASKPAEKDDGLRIAWQYRRYLQQGKSLDDSRVGRGGGALAAGVSVTGASASSSSGSATKKNTGGVRRLPEMCHQFDLTREMDPAHADAADLRCVPFERAPELVPSRADRASSNPGGDDDPCAVAFRECDAMARRCGDAHRAPPDAPVGRIALQPTLGFDPVTSASALARFLRALRGRLRGTRACAMVAVPLASMPPASANLLRHWADAAVDVETLPQESHLDQLLPDPNLCVGLLHCRKIQFPNVIGASPLTRMDRTYALQLRRRRIAVRPLRVAPEDEPPAGRSGREKKVGGGGNGNGSGNGNGRGTGEKTSASAGGLCGSGPPGAADPLDF